MPYEITMLPGTSASSPSSDRLEVVQRSFGITLSHDYVDFLRSTNGGIPIRRYFSLAGNEKVVERFLSLVEAYKADPLGIYDIEVVWSQIEERLNDSLVPIAEVFAGDFLCLDFSKSSEPAVILWDHEKSRVDVPYLMPVAPSLGHFIEMLHD